MKKKGWFWVVLVCLLIYRFVDWYRKVEKYEIGQRLRVKTCLKQDAELTGSGQKFKVGEFWVLVRGEERLWAGDCVFVEGKLDDFEKESGSCERNCWLMADEMRVMGSKKIYEVSGVVRRRLVGVIKKNLPKREADLIAGMVLGIKSGMGNEFYEALRRTGTLHIVVASGSNVALVAGSVVGGLAYVLGRKVALVVGMVVIWFYGVLSGFDAPILRAGIMGSILLLGQGLGRKFEVWRALAAAVLILVIFNPGMLFEVSFQLSVGAMAGVLLAGKKKGFKREVLVGWWVFLVIWPMIGWHFSEVQWLGLGVNMLVLPLVGGMTILGMAGSLAGLIPVVGGVLSRVFLWAVYPLAWYFVRVVDWIGRYEWISLMVKMNWVMVLGYYLILGWWLLRRRKKHAPAELDSSPR